MGWFYTASHDAQTIPFVGPSGVDDLLVFTIAADTPIRLWSFEINNISDLQDAQEQTPRFEIVRGFSAGIGGTALTEAAVDDHAPAATTAVVSRPTQGTGGTIVKRMWWNSLQPGPVWIAETEEAALRVSAASNSLLIRVGAFLSEITIGYEVLWEEL